LSRSGNQNARGRAEAAAIEYGTCLHGIFRGSQSPLESLPQDETENARLPAHTAPSNCITPVRVQ
jgi:hypothetical protein